MVFGTFQETYQKPDILMDYADWKGGHIDEGIILLGPLPSSSS